MDTDIVTDSSADGAGMGRYDFRPLRVHQHASQQMKTGRIQSAPSWFNIIENVPPAQILVRTQPVQHQEQVRHTKTKKPSRMFQPQRLAYQEDSLRKEFFKDHPWELARPRVILENDGKDGQRNDWSKLRQLGRRVDGESVIQRQLWLLQNIPDITTAKAYDQARQEFYALRHEEDVERRVAKEEALATGAYFGKSTLEFGMELEDKVFEEWKAAALKTIEEQQQARGAAYSGSGSDDSSVSLEGSGLDASVDELGGVPAQGQNAYGGAAIHP
ncbi:MAG: mitochondrial ribosomal small subunit component [Pycnora praestabilis]|nr:MAG: mitochondrial ribosomal small subunit component [Pycnora praestabilis]